MHSNPPKDSQFNRRQVATMELPASKHCWPARHQRLQRHGLITLVLTGMLAGALMLATARPVFADPAADKKPYDKQLLRLSELLGAVHYLRELCGANDGMLWRKQMESLIKAEGTSALRRLQLTRKFNFGYHSYSRTYHRCTPSAKTAIKRFLNEAGVISDTMVQNIK